MRERLNIQNLSSGYSVRASKAYMAAYEEREKNKEFTQVFEEGDFPASVDFNRHNYLIPLEGAIKTQQVDSQIVAQKIAQFTESEQVTRLVKALGGQASQGSLTKLLWIGLVRDKDKAELIPRAHFDIALYFWVGEKLCYVTLNLNYGIFLEKPSLILFKPKQRFYVLESDAPVPTKIAEGVCGALEAALSNLHEEINGCLGFASLNEELPVEMAAQDIIKYLKTTENFELSEFITLVEQNVTRLIKDYLIQQKNTIINSKKNQILDAREAKSLAKLLLGIDDLLKKDLRPIMTSGDYMTFEKKWSHLEVKCPQNEDEYSKLLGKWFLNGRETDLLFVRSLAGAWMAYEKTQQGCDSLKLPSESVFGRLLNECKAENVQDYDLAPLRDALEKEPLFGVTHQTRAIRQMDLIVNMNTDQVKNNFLLDENAYEHMPSNFSEIPVASAEEKSKVRLNERTKVIRAIFNKMRDRETSRKGFICDQLPATHLDQLLTFLIQHFKNNPDYADLSDIEFLHLAHFSVNYFAEHAHLHSISFEKAKADYYAKAFIVEIQKKKNTLLMERGKLIDDLRNFSLSKKGIKEFARGLETISSEFFKISKPFFDRPFDSFKALFVDLLSRQPDIGAYLDELIYRLTYVYQSEGSDNPVLDQFRVIFFQELIHLKMMQETGWTREEADILMLTEQKTYWDPAVKFQNDMKALIDSNMQKQKEEKQRFESACNAIDQEGARLANSLSPEDQAAGPVMRSLAQDLRNRIMNYHNEGHYVSLSKTDYSPKERAKLIRDIEAIIINKVKSNPSLVGYDDLGERIKVYALNALMGVLTVVTLGIAPIIRKFAMNTSAFFTSKREEIIEATQKKIIKMANEEPIQPESPRLAVRVAG
jgi:hypothetical protein